MILNLPRSVDMQSPTNYSKEEERTPIDSTLIHEEPTGGTPLPGPSDISSEDVGTGLLRPTRGLTTSHEVRFTWLNALKNALPIYLATHIAFLLLTYLATLFAFTPKNFSLYSLPLSTLVQSWDRWDSNQFVEIATKGYDVAYRTAFFPLYPMLES